jgi:hypothetical protein
MRKDTPIVFPSPLDCVIFVGFSNFLDTWWLRELCGVHLES